MNLVGLSRQLKKKVGIPSLALKLGYSIKKCLYILKGQALRTNASIQKLDNFLQLLEAEWNSSVSTIPSVSCQGRNLTK